MEEAKYQRGAEPNARFIVLDPNGEYASTFKGMGNVRVFAADPAKDVKQLKVPLWLWNSAEWCAFTQASSKTQRPTLIQALRSVRDGNVEMAVTPCQDMRRYLRTLVSAILIERNSGSPWSTFPKPKSFFEKISIWESGLVENDSFTPEQKNALTTFKANINELVKIRTQTPQNKFPTFEFQKQEIDELLTLAQASHSAFGGSDTDVLPIDADVPRTFTGQQLLRSVEANAELLGVTDHVETMLMRIRTILSDTRMNKIINDTEGLKLHEWLSTYIGNSDTSNGSVTVIDLSLIPAEVVHIITAVIARMTLEALQRYRKLNDGKLLPTVLVMEEAHTFIRRYSDDSENQNSAAICCQVFEKIAREGRKFGLGLVLSSQRPSELSQTVLSQCNSYLLHRISNDRDQELVHKLVPDNLRGLLRDLPSLPSRHAILLGWASELPVLVQMNSLPAEQRPKSDDPDFWKVWSGYGLEKDAQDKPIERVADWSGIADDWQQKDTKKKRVKLIEEHE